MSISVDSPYADNKEQENIVANVNTFNFNSQQLDAFNDKVTQDLAQLNHILNDEHDPDKAYIFVTMVLFQDILSVSTSQQNVEASSEGVASSVGALASEVSDLQGAGGSYTYTGPTDDTNYAKNMGDPTYGTGGMSADQATEFYEASADLLFDVNCTSYTTSDGVNHQGNYLSMLDTDTKAQISSSIESIWSPYTQSWVGDSSITGKTSAQVAPTEYTDANGNSYGANTTLNGDINNTDFVKSIRAQSNFLWNDDTDGYQTAPGSSPTVPIYMHGQGLNSSQSEINDAFSTIGDVTNGAVQVFNMYLQNEIQSTNQDMGTVNKISDQTIEWESAEQKNQKS